MNTTIHRWVELYAEQLFTFAFYKTSDKETAEDLVQETFLSAVKSFHTFQEKSEAKTWLFAILKNKIADHFRKTYLLNEQTRISYNEMFDEDGNWKTNQRPQAWNTDDDEKLPDNPDFQRTLTHCLDKLPAQWKSSIVLKFMEEKESSHICQELEISPSNYWQILHRAKLQLRKCLESNWFKK